MIKINNQVMKRFSEDILYIQAPEAGETAEYQAQNSMVFVIDNDNIEDISLIQSLQDLIIEMPDNSMIIIRDAYRFDKTTEQWQEDKIPFILSSSGEVIDSDDILLAIGDDMYNDDNAFLADFTFFSNGIGQRYEFETDPIGEEMDFADVLGDTAPLFIDTDMAEADIFTIFAPTDTTNTVASFEAIVASTGVENNAATPIFNDVAMMNPAYDDGIFDAVDILQEAADMTNADAWIYHA